MKGIEGEWGMSLNKISNPVKYKLTNDVNSNLQFEVKWSSKVDSPWIARFLRLNSSPELSVLTGRLIDNETSNANTVGMTAFVRL